MVLADNILKELLSQKNILPEKEIADLVVFARNSHNSLQEAAIEKGIISDPKMGHLLADYLEVPFIELSKTVIPEEVFQVIPERVARKHKIIVFAMDDETIKLGMADPHDQQIAELVAKKTSKKAHVHLATETDIAATLQLYRKDLQKSIDELVKKEVGVNGSLINDAPVIKIVDLLITYAYRDKASDIHIEPEEENVLVRFRIDGILHDVLVINKNLHSAVVTRIKVLANLRTDEHLTAQDGKLRMLIDEENLDIRVSVIPTTDLEKVVLRLLSSKFRSFSLTDLGMDKKDLQKVNEAVSKSYGMILSTGPTGSGKTTSIYAFLKILNTRERNITTIEDPVEFRIKGVNHIPVNTNTGFTFATGLRSILRQDPDIIFVGEIRDPETASLAVNSALTGHLVLSTLHTNDAATALPRLIDMKVEPFLIASTVNLIIAQRLIRKICPQCKTETHAKRADLLKHIPGNLLERHFGKKDEITVYKGKGCKNCRSTGYLGRIGLFEVLEMTETIRKLILERSDSAAIRKAAVAEGMITLLDDGLAKAANGETTLTEVMRVMKIEHI